MKLILIIFSLSLFHLSGSINPIILIPGVGGSQIEVKMDKTADVNRFCRKSTDEHFSLWINTLYCMTRTPLCIYHVLKLIYDKETHNTSDRKGIDIHIPGFGSIDKSGYLDTTSFMTPYFNAIVNMLMKEGYNPGTSLKAAPYDFRKGPHEQIDYVKRLRDLIVKTYEENGEQQVILIVHSLGGLLTMMFLQQQDPDWKDKYIKCVISLSVAWAGSVKAIEGYLKGFSFRLAEIKRTSSKFSTLSLLEQSRSYVRLPKLTLVPSSLLQTMPSIIWLFPSSKAWKVTDPLVRSRTPDEQIYTLKNMKQFFEDLGDESGWEMYKGMKRFKEEVSDPGVKLYCLYGYDIDTVALVDHDTSFWGSLKFPITRDGDGLVNLQSLQVCEKWSEKNTRVKTESFRGVSHLGILSNSDVLKYISFIIRSI